MATQFDFDNADHLTLVRDKIVALIDGTRPVGTTAFDYDGLRYLVEAPHVHQDFGVGFRKSEFVTIRPMSGNATHRDIRKTKWRTVDIDAIATALASRVRASHQKFKESLDAEQAKKDRAEAVRAIQREWVVALREYDHSGDHLRISGGTGDGSWSGRNNQDPAVYVRIVVTSDEGLRRVKELLDALRKDG